MAITLQWFQDAGLTTQADPFGINHEVDGSNDPQDFIFYLGSTTASRQFQDAVDPGVNQVTVSIVNATPVWQADYAWALNDICRTTAKNGYQYKAVAVSGNSDAAEPVWPTVIGNQVVDGGVTWECIGRIHESTEIKLALSAAGLDAATAGASLDLGTTLTSGTANAVPVYMRIDDATGTISTAQELSLQTQTLIESPTA